MSAILSADDLNDFISPGVACIKPVETLPKQQPAGNEYEVTTEDKLAAENPAPAQISLTDCLACSGCVTSAEAVLVSLQSHAEVLASLDSGVSIPEDVLRAAIAGAAMPEDMKRDGRVFVASVSPQVRASLAATYGMTEKEAGFMIEQLLRGPQGVATGGKFGNGFAWVLDTNAMREVCLTMEAEEVQRALKGHSAAKKPLLTSACPGWICYAEKTHPHVLPHLSNLKSPQALSGTLLKSCLSRKLGIKPSQIWHLAVMPCFDKKLEGARQELTDAHWSLSEATDPPTRDVDCVITAREILMLADERGISFPALPREPLRGHLPLPSPTLDRFFSRRRLNRSSTKKSASGTTPSTSGGFLHHVLLAQQALHPGSRIVSRRGRNADVLECEVIVDMPDDAKVVFRANRYYGFRNIQNLVRRLRPARPSRIPGGKAVGARRPAGGAKAGAKEEECAYVEVMACPGGCTNGGGQIKVADLGELQAAHLGVEGQKEWLAKVDEAYFSMEDDDQDIVMGDAEVSGDVVDGISISEVKGLIDHWEDLTSIPREKLLYTTFHAVESDVGKQQTGTEKAVELASKIGGGW